MNTQQPFPLTIDIAGCVAPLTAIAAIYLFLGVVVFTLLRRQVFEPGASPRET